VNVFKFGGITKAPIPVERVLNGALADNLDIVLVLGRDADGELRAYASVGTNEVNVLLCEEFKHELLSGKLGEA